ncbi:MAG: hypothetical protein PSU94_17270 [Lacunisphaera sp.]|nr:hypothetical protein [Lacunisphaera sp.]
MSVLFLRILILVEIVLVVFLILRLPSLRRPSASLWMLATFCVAVGTVLMYKSHLDYGWWGPLGFLKYIPARIHFVSVTLREKVNSWGFLDPFLYGGAFGLCYLAGGAGLIRLRAWARRLLLWVSGILATMSLVHLVVFLSRLGPAEAVFEVVLLVFSSGSLWWLCQPVCTAQFLPPKLPPSEA